MFKYTVTFDTFDGESLFVWVTAESRYGAEVAALDTAAGFGITEDDIINFRVSPGHRPVGGKDQLK